jgi:hypothetical protein
LSSVLIAVGLVAAMLALLEAGRKVGLRDFARDPEHAGKGLGPLAGSLYGLMGLLIAFTFSGAASRFDARRALIVEEANAIGTAYLRISLLPDESQPQLREGFRNYLDARLEFYRKLPNDAAQAQAADVRAGVLLDSIWKQTVEATQRTGGSATASTATANAVTSLVIQALNAMIDIRTTRSFALEIHPPTAVYVMLVIVLLVCSLLAGYESAASPSRSWIHIAGYTLILAASILVILDYEHPRQGLLRVDPADQVLLDLRNSMR